MALWSVAAVAVAASGGAAYAATDTGSVEVLSAGQVDAALDDADEPAKADSPSEDEGAAPGAGDDDAPGVEPEPGGDIEQRTKTTEAGTVTVACSGDIIGMDSVTPAAGWDFTGPEGGVYKAEVTFTTDDPKAGENRDALVVTFACDDGEVVWHTEYR